MKTTKILSALVLLAVSLGLFKFAYATANGPVALAALIIGALFIYSGISLTMDEESVSIEKLDERHKGFQEAMKHHQQKEPSFKGKIKKEIIRLNAVKTGINKPTTVAFKRMNYADDRVHGPNHRFTTIDMEQKKKNHIYYMRAKAKKVKYHD